MPDPERAHAAAATGGARADSSASGDAAENLSRSTMSGLRWTYLQSAVIATLQIAYTATMSRLLDDTDFGLLALGQLLVNFGLYFAQLGVGRALIQRKDLRPDHVRAAFTSAVVLGVTASGLSWVLAPWLAEVFDAPRFVGVMRALGLAFAVLGLGVTAQAVLRRGLRFRELALIESTAFLIGYVGLGIGSALLGAGVYSLVAAVLGSYGTASLLKLLRARHDLRPVLRAAPYRDLYAFGVRTSGVQVLEYLGNNLDTAVVGRTLSAGLLGQYNRAFYLLQLPIHYLVQSVAGVLFPSLSKIQDDPVRLRGALRSALLIIGTSMVPALTGMAVAAPELVRVLLGPGWEPAAAVVPVFAVAATFKVLSRFPAILAEARGRLNTKLAVEICSIALFGGLLVLAIGRGLWAYAAASAVTEVVRHTAYLLLLRRLVGVHGGELARVYLPIAVASAAVGGGIALVRWVLLDAGAPAAGVLAADVVTGGLVLLAVMRTPPLRIVRAELGSRLQRAGVLPAANPLIARGVRLVLGPQVVAGQAGTRT